MFHRLFIYLLRVTWQAGKNIKIYETIWINKITIIAKFLKIHQFIASQLSYHCKAFLGMLLVITVSKYLNFSFSFSFPTKAIYKQWNGLLEQNTGISYFFPFWTSFCIYFRRSQHFSKVTSSQQQWMTIVLKIIAYCSAFSYVST